MCGCQAGFQFILIVFGLIEYSQYLLAIRHIMMRQRRKSFKQQMFRRSIFRFDHRSLNVHTEGERTTSIQLFSSGKKRLSKLRRKKNHFYFSNFSCGKTSTIKFNVVYILTSHREIKSICKVVTARESRERIHQQIQINSLVPNFFSSILFCLCVRLLCVMRELFECGNMLWLLPLPNRQ